MKKKTLLVWCMALAIAACDNIDCTLYNSVNLFSTFYQSGKTVSITDTLTVRLAKTDSIVLNRKVGASKLTLPLSYFDEVDTFSFTVKGNDYEVTDKVWVEKSSTTHFESPDCPATRFHHITAVRCTHNFLDTIIIYRPDVDFKQIENLQLHLHPAAE